MMKWLRRRQGGSPAAEADRREPPAAPSVSRAEALRKQGNDLLAKGDTAGAAEAYRHAVAAGPGHPGAWVNLGYALHELREFADARVALSRAAELDPQSDDAWYLLGCVECSAGEMQRAIGHFESALGIRPAFEACRRDLCAALASTGDVTSAIRVAERGIEIDPRAGELHHVLGNLHRQVGDLDKSVVNYRMAVAALPDSATPWASLGRALEAAGQAGEAGECFRKALQLDPGSAEAYLELGLLDHRRGAIDAAIAAYRQGLALAPAHAELLSNLGAALMARRRPDEARRVLGEAIRMTPDHPGSLINLGAVLCEQGELDAAAEHYQRALALTPGNAAAHGNLGTVLQEMGRHDQAIASFRRALELDPGFKDPQSNLLFTLNYHPDSSAEEIFEGYREFDRRVALPMGPAFVTHSNSRDTARRLKVGYVSPDFRHHSTRHFLEPLLAHHDKGAVEVFAYAEVTAPDATTARYRALIDPWVPTVGLSDAALAQRIRDDAIDILVDLAGHTANNRLGAFARKPAPVSMSWMGFGYTTGVSAIDYMLTDEASTPTGSEHLFAERPWRLATPGYAYRQADDMGEVNPLPAQQRGHVTFGTLTRSVRINHRSIRVWSDVLRRVPGSRLIVDSKNYRDPGMRSMLIANFAEHGIAPERLQIGFHSPPWDVLRDMDIGLDCFPHNSGTTLFESLYMGVPFVTLAGRPSVGRLGSSILHGVGHPEWIAQSETGYADLAVALASDLPRLAQLRRGLRAQMRASALMDEAAFAAKVEAAYREMFARWAGRSGDRASATS